MKVYRAFASAVTAYHYCAKSSNLLWKHKWEVRINELCVKHMPSGGGFNTGTVLLLRRSTGEKLVFCTEYHHMNDVGGYDGWTRHLVTVRPSLLFEVRVTISGQDKNGIKDYIHEQFEYALNLEEESIL